LTDNPDRSAMLSLLPATARSADRFFGSLTDTIIGSGILPTSRLSPRSVRLESDNLLQPVTRIILGDSRNGAIQSRELPSNDRPVTRKRTSSEDLTACPEGFVIRVSVVVIFPRLLLTNQQRWRQWFIPHSILPQDHIQRLRIGSVFMSELLVNTSGPLFLGAEGNGSVQRWKMPAQGGPASQVTSTICHDPFESPEDHLIFFESRLPGIWQVPTNGGQEKLIPELADVYPSRHMTVANGTIYFVRSETSPRFIQRDSISTHRIETVATIDHELVSRTRSLTVSPDLKWVVNAQEDHSSSDLMLLKKF
jgi:hypothetical protein